MKPMTDTEFQFIVDFVRDHVGINLEKKRTLIESRLSLYMERRGFNSYASYICHIRQNPNGEECRNMINRLSTNYTFFFREPAYIEYLNHKLLPELCEKQSTLNIWCAGCSGGEECFSVAAVLEQYMQFYGKHIDYHILATDIDTELLASAQVGQYPISELDKIPVQYRFIQKNGKTFAFSAEIQKKIEWKYENLLECSYISQFDIIFCRNVMIYFKNCLRETLTKRFYDALKPGGCLFISATESIDIKTRLFQHEKQSAYRKR